MKVRASGNRTAGAGVGEAFQTLAGHLSGSVLPELLDGHGEGRLVIGKVKRHE
jgi:hypothetical protein